MTQNLENTQEKQEETQEISQKSEYISQKLIHLKENFNRYLNPSRNSGFVISLRGHWGVGKTYFWHLYAKSLDEEKYVYISLFGLNKLEEIKERIINKISTNANFLSKARGVIGRSRIIGLDIAAILSSLGRKNFKNITICFDDFERISPNLNLSEVLGFISKLKEQYACKIVLINNMEMLKEQDQINNKKIFEKLGSNSTEKYFITQINNYEIFEKYIEKIVDIELDYEPHIEDTIKILQTNENKSFIDWELMEKLFLGISNRNKRTNLRYMQKYLLKLEIVKELLEDKEIDKIFKDEICIEIFQKVLDEKVDFKSLNLIETFYIKSLYFKDLIEENYINIKSIKEDITKIKENFKDKKDESYKDTLNNLYFNYLYNLQIKDKDFIKEMYKMLFSKKDIINILHISDLIFYINLLINLDNSNKKRYQKLLLIKLKRYIKENFNKVEFDYSDIDKFLDDKNKKEIKEYYYYLKQSQKFGIKDVIQNILKTETYSAVDEKLLSEVSKDELKNKMINDKEYFELIFTFMQWLKGFVGANRPFIDFYRLTKSIYKELEKKEEYKHRMHYVLGTFGIDEDKKEKIISKFVL